MSGLRVLVVEDEALISMMIEEAVSSAGHEVAATVSNITDAMHAASTCDFDVALLDINLNGQKAHALPVVLSARGKPFGFVTGYGESGVMDQFADAPILKKPFRSAEIEDILRRLGAKAR